MTLNVKYVSLILFKLYGLFVYNEGHMGQVSVLVFTSNHDPEKQQGPLKLQPIIEGNNSNGYKWIKMYLTVGLLVHSR